MTNARALFAVAVAVIAVGLGVLAYREDNSPPRASPVPVETPLPANAVGEPVGRAKVPVASLADAAVAAAARVEAAPGSLRVELTCRQQPAAAMPVELEPAAAEGDARVRVLSDARGVARFAALAAGTYVLRVADRVLHVVVAPSGETVQQLAFDDLREVRGEVVDPADRPCAGAIVWVRNPRGGDACEVTTTDAAGAFAVLVAAPVLVGTHAAGYAATHALVDGDAAGPVHVRLRLPGLGSTLRVAVVGPAGAPAADALVQIGCDGLDTTHPELQAWSRSVRRVRTDAEGTCVVVGLVPGPMPVTALARDGACAQQVVTLAAGADREVRLDLAAAAAIAGRVTDAHGQPVASAQLEVALGEGLGRVRASAAADGTYRMTGVPARAARAYATARDAGGRTRRAAATLLLRPGEVIAWDPVLRADTGEVAGRVLHQDGTAAPDCIVVATIAASQRRVGTARTDADGRFRLELGSACDAVLDVDVHASEELGADGWPASPVCATRAGWCPGEGPLELRLAATVAPRPHLPSRLVVAADGVERRLLFTGIDRGPRAAVSFVLLDAVGRELGRGLAGSEWGPVVAELCVVPGHYRVVAATSTGLRGDLDLIVGDERVLPWGVVVELR